MRSVGLMSRVRESSDGSVTGCTSGEEGRRVGTVSVTIKPTVSVAVVGMRDAPETFLASSVPNLKRRRVIFTAPVVKVTKK